MRPKRDDGKQDEQGRSGSNGPLALGFDAEVSGDLDLPATDEPGEDWIAHEQPTHWHRRNPAIIRKGIEPQKVLAPDEGESITNWAKREAQFRRQKTASDTPHEEPKPKRSMKSELAEGELPVRPLSERRYRMLQRWAKTGVFLVDPEHNGRTLVVTVTELASPPSMKPSAVQTRYERKFRRPSTRQFKSRLRSRRQCC